VLLAGAGGARQGILSLAIKDKAALYNAYMPYLKTGGIFVPTPKRYFLGDEVFLLLTLLEEKDRLPVAGKVVWVTPPGAQGNRAAGIGVQFADSAEGEAVRHKIETILAGHADRRQAHAHDVGPSSPAKAGIHGSMWAIRSAAVQDPLLQRSCAPTFRKGSCTASLRLAGDPIARDHNVAFGRGNELRGLG
jgi:type IV pilus assembly protein PilZ